MFNPQQLHENQKNALNIDNSIWVSASAGSGKTTILVKRLLKLLLNNIDLSKIVCITYTKTGANEMKTRIYKELSKWVILNDDDLKRNLSEFYLSYSDTDLLLKARTLFARVIDNIDELKILTIHSFCQQILKKFPLEAGILPNFEIMENSKELINDCTNKFLKNIDKYPDFSDKIRNIIKYKNEEQFYSLINAVLAKQQDLNLILSFNYDFKNDLYKLFGLYKNDTEKNFLNEFINNLGFVDVNYFKNHIYENLTDKQREHFNVLLEWNNYDDDYKNDNYENYLAVFLTKEFDKRKFGNEFKKISSINEECVSTIIQEQDRCYDFYQNITKIKTINITISILEISLKILEVYQNEKQQRGILDYDDLIIYTLKLLTNTEYSAWINYKLDSGIEHILLDEAQDTSKIQWGIIQQLTEEFFSGKGVNEKNRSIFVVGDEKQSIFKFQGASPNMFSEQYNFYKYTIENCNKFINKIDLEYSFRSLPAILKFTDTVFQQIENATRISKLTNIIKHNCLRSSEENQGLIEVWPLIEPAKKTETAWQISFENDNEIKTKEQLALNIALKIREIITKNKVITVKNKEKNVDFKDIIILLKNRDEILLSYLIRKLNEFNIPNSGFDKTTLLENIIVKDFLSILEFVVFPQDDFILASLFKSPILNMEEEELFFLCRYKIENNYANLFESLKEFCNNYDNKTLKFISFLQQNTFQNFKFNIDNYKQILLILNDFILKSKDLIISEFIYYIINNFDIKIRFLERFSNNFLEIFKQFMNYIKNFESNNTITIFNFLQNIKENNLEIKKDLDHSINQVRIMTVHASKGLEAPIVFVINSSYNTISEDLIWNEDDFDYKLPIFTKFSKTDIYQSIKENIKENNYAEYLRLFYVAITRAENELYICGCKNLKEKTESEAKDDGKKTWYDLAYLAIKTIGYQKKFEFDDTTEKYIYGDEKQKYYKIDNNEVITQNIDNNILNNIKKLNFIQKENKQDEEFQFLKHLDRDNNILSINIAITRGNAVHKLLEILPLTKKEERDEIADIYLNNSFFTLSKQDRITIKQKVFQILDHPDYQEFFDENSKSEVNIMGQLGDKNVPKRIDRLVVKKDEVIIIDYKNTINCYQTKEQLPREFITQLKVYKDLISKIYKNRKITCYILLTSHIKLIKVE